MIRPDTELFRAINGFAGRSAVLDGVGVFLAEGLVYLVAAAAVVPPVYFAVRRRWRRWGGREAAREARLTAAAVHAAGTAMLALIGNYLFSLIVFRPRPFVALRDVAQLVDMPAAYKSFPSDHTSLAFAIAFSVLMFRRGLGIALLACAALIGLARVYVGVHYPADIAAGVLVGLFWAWIARIVGRRTREIERLTRYFKKRPV
jgi:undecaprenyl-diphosphatase